MMTEQQTETPTDNVDTYGATATYSPDDNKLRIDFVSRQDQPTIDRLKAHGYRWAPNQKIWVAPKWTPARFDLAVELAGIVEDDDQSLVDRAEIRAERFEGYSDNRAADARSARDAVSRIADNIPLGQPILIGHHSERRARKDAEKIQRGMDRAVQMWETSKYWKSRAAGALGHAKYKELPKVRARRIKTIEAERRVQQRYYDKAETWTALWRGLTLPGKDAELRPGLVAMDAPPASDDVQLKRARLFANHDGVRLADNDPRGFSIWSALDAGKMTPIEARDIAVRVHERTMAYALRWIEHYNNRLAYERAMLVEQGAGELLQPKPKPKQLPLCNYRDPAGVVCDRTNYGASAQRYELLELTSAQYAEIGSDYKGTRVVDHSHRVRVAMWRKPGDSQYGGRSLYYVFLTDSKVHARPAPIEPALPAPRPAAIYVPKPTDPEDLAFQQIAKAAKDGVTVVTAPQLFPTPIKVARDLVDMAMIRSDHHRVLEPSAGTGRLLDCVWPLSPAETVAIEINPQLASGLAQRYPHVRTMCRDFLEVTPDEIGLFDRIVMNPPFENGSDVRHILHALSFLKPGGILMAICADGPRQRATFEETAHNYEPLPANSFAPQTTVNTAIVTFQKD